MCPGEEVPHRNRREKLPEAPQQHERGEQEHTGRSVVSELEEEDNKKNNTLQVDFVLTEINFLNRNFYTSANLTLFMRMVLLIAPLPPLPPPPPFTCPLLTFILLGHKR